MENRASFVARRAKERGKRPVRVANCSGYAGDPSWQMLRQASDGDVDFITGDYLAEMNMAENAEAFRAGKHPGYVDTAWAGLKQSLDVIAARGIKVVINGGSINPSGLAAKVAALSIQRGYDLKIAFVSGDDLLPILGTSLAALRTNLPPHLDSDNKDVKLPWNILGPSQSAADVPLVSANAYLGARAIVHGLHLGADIIICGRVADASPVIGAAWYWHDWSAEQYDALAGALIAGHLIECSAYVTGGNFAGFTEYEMGTFVEPGFPVAEIERDGTCVVTKHEGTGGMVNVDTVRCQFLYELQGSMYLNSDVKAYLNGVKVQAVSKDRVRISGIRGAPPPATTKATIFYRGGFQSQILLNATGYGTDQKWNLFEAQMKKKLKVSGADNDLSILEFQRIGVPEANPRSQLRSTTYLRIFAESTSSQALMEVVYAVRDISLQHFSGFHSALDMRTAIPKPFLAMYPALIPQSSLPEAITFLSQTTGHPETAIPVGHPPRYEELERRENEPVTISGRTLTSFGPTTAVRLGDLVLARSGDKGGNLNVGFFVRSAPAWEWLRVYLSSARLQALMGEDWNDEYFMERVEFGEIWAVHFVVYGILGRGVSSSTRLDALGKGAADWLRDRVVDVPLEVLHVVKL